MSAPERREPRPAPGVPEDTSSHVQASVILPTYRRPEVLAQAIDSVRRQTMTSWELIVVDDNDPGDPARVATQRVVESYGHDMRVRYLQHDANRGGSAARNTGIRASQAPFVAFLDDDDAWSSSKLEEQVRVLENADEDVALVYCAVRRVNHVTGETRIDRPDPEAATLRHLLKKNTIGTTSAVTCRRDALLDVGLFDEGLSARQDVDLYVRLALRYRFVSIDRPLVTWHRHVGPSIGTNLGAAIDAHQAFHDKHRARILAWPDVHAARLVTLGRFLVAAGRYREARRAFLKAWRLRPFQWPAPVFLATAHPWPQRVLDVLLSARRRPPKGRRVGARAEGSAGNSRP